MSRSSILRAFALGIPVVALWPVFYFFNPATVVFGFFPLKYVAQIYVDWFKAIPAWYSAIAYLLVVAASYLVVRWTKWWAVIAAAVSFSILLVALSTFSTPAILAAAGPGFDRKLFTRSELSFNLGLLQNLVGTLLILLLVRNLLTSRRRRNASQAEIGRWIPAPAPQHQLQKPKKLTEVRAKVLTWVRFREAIPLSLGVLIVWPVFAIYQLWLLPLMLVGLVKVPLPISLFTEYLKVISATRNPFLLLSYILWFLILLAYFLVLKAFPNVWSFLLCSHFLIMSAFVFYLIFQALESTEVLEGSLINAILAAGFLVVRKRCRNRDQHASTGNINAHLS